MSRPLACIAFSLLTVAHSSFAGEVALARKAMQRIATLRVHETAILPGFPLGPTTKGSVRLERVEIYAPDAHIYALTATGKEELPRSRLIFLRGATPDGTARVALAFKPDGSFSSGVGTGIQGPFAVVDTVDASGAHVLGAKSLDAATPKSLEDEFHCGNEDEGVSSRRPQAPLAPWVLPGTSGRTLASRMSHALRFATVAIDADSTLNANLFSSNTASATDWIAKMFNTTNLLYERDALTRIYVGTTILRLDPASDPYVATGPAPIVVWPVDHNDLHNFEAYWQANEIAVPRAFALLLTAAGPCVQGHCHSSGIGGIGLQCSSTGPGQNYVVVQPFANIADDPDATNAGSMYAHELGHNMGLAHTHCTDVTTGQYKTATNTIDICSNGESAIGCYAGAATACPAAGGGTIMSYCSSACGKDFHFHSTQINAPAPYGLLANIEAAQQATTCFNDVDDIFFDGFE